VPRRASLLTLVDRQASGAGASSRLRARRIVCVVLTGLGSPAAGRCVWAQESTPYQGGVFIVDIKIPDNYPFVPPKMRFETKIWHPNVSRCVPLRWAQLTARRPSCARVQCHWRHLPRHPQGPVVTSAHYSHSLAFAASAPFLPEPWCDAAWRSGAC
jgi:hypothetical protein